MKRPSFQFYPADWRNNAKLRRCSEAARGAWMDVICVLHDSDEYGVCRWPLADIARAAGVSLKLIRELADKDVLKGGDKGCDPYIYTPVSGRVHGNPVTLVESENGKPCWYCSRLVRDEYVRQRRGLSTHFTSTDQPQNKTPKSSPKGGMDERQGDGTTSASASSLTETKQGGNDSTLAGMNPQTAGAAGTGKRAPDNPGKPSAAEVCKALRDLGLQNANPGHAKLLALLEAGAAIDEFTGAAQYALANGKPSFSYILGTVEGRRRDAKAAAACIVQGALKHKSKPWFFSASGIEAKAAELGIEKVRDEIFPDFKARVFKAAGITPEMVRQAGRDYGVMA